MSDKDLDIEKAVISATNPEGEIEKGGVLVLGNFDGVHRGHQAVIKAAIGYARRHGMKARVLTMEPHPHSLFKAGPAPFRLTPWHVKVRLLQELGVDEVLVLPFSHELAQLEASAFVGRLLIGRLGAQHVVAGFDFVFGRQRLGNIQSLRTWLASYRIGVTEVAPLRDAKGEILSSTRVRAAVQEGDLEAARQILGRPFALVGTVVPGARRGNLLGFPTANIELGDYLRPRYGVYAIVARRVGTDNRLLGVANIGTRPTIDGGHELLEFHLLDFQGDLYGQEWEVELHHFLRAEQTFPSLKILQENIAHDIATARNLLARPLGIA